MWSAVRSKRRFETEAISTTELALVCGLEAQQWEFLGHVKTQTADHADCADYAV